MIFLFVVLFQLLSLVHGLQHARLFYPLLSPGVCSNSCPLCHCCYLTMSCSASPFSFSSSIFPSIRVFFSESALHIRWSKYQGFSFSISSSNEYSGLISFRIDWFDLLAEILNRPFLQLFFNTSLLDKCYEDTRSRKFYQDSRVL